MIRLELQAQAKLHDSRASAPQTGIALGNVGGLRDQSGIRRANVNNVRRQCKVGVIEDVEKLSAELKRELFAHCKDFAERKIRVPESWAIDLVAAEIPEITTWIREGEWIQIASGGCPMREDKGLAGNDVRSLHEIEIDAAIGRDDVDGAARLHGENGVELPAVGQEFRQTRNHRGLVVQGRRPSMTRVKRGWAFFRGKICRILWERGVSEIEVDAVGGTIERFGESVGGKAGESVELLEAHGGL